MLKEHSYSVFRSDAIPCWQSICDQLQRPAKPQRLVQFQDGIPAFTCDHIAGEGYRAEPQSAQADFAMAPWLRPGRPNLIGYRHIIDWHESHRSDQPGLKQRIVFGPMMPRRER